MLWTDTRKLLCLIRMKNNESMKQMAEKLGYNYGYISAIETETRPLTSEFIKRLIDNYKLKDEEISRLVSIQNDQLKKRYESKKFIPEYEW